ncbi:MAG: M14 family zinc carboxypeptidase [Ignavibacteriaceae bacterium]
MQKKFLLIVLFIFPILFSCKSKEEKVTALPYDPPGATITTDKEISLQHQRIISFSNTGVFVSNEFSGARLNDFYKVNDTTYTAVIEPENAPINDSPWYSFKIWSKSDQNITLNLTYKDGTHRYKPKVSYDGKSWQLLDTNKVFIDTTINVATLKLNVTKDTLWISAQELITSKFYVDWISQLLKKEFVRKGIIGSSSQGKSLHKLEIGKEGNSNFVVIIGRNHPPEVTGFFALKSFVETIAGGSEIAKEFRENFTTVVIPLVNPDGVDNGHWRHNYKGVDLNRDWVEFNQPEPRAVKNEVERIIGNGGKIIFFIDFHSTQQDVFYIFSMESLISDDISAVRFEKRKYAYDLVEKWLTNLQSKLPDYKVNIVDTLSSPTSPTSDRWLMREFDVPSLTYEVGDETNRELVDQVAYTASIELMKLLLKKNKIETFNSDN